MSACTSLNRGRQRTSAKRLILPTRTREISDIQGLCALHYRWSAQSFIKGACVAVRVMALLTEKYQIVVVVTDSFSACQKYQPGQHPHLSTWNSIFPKKKKKRTKKMENFVMGYRKENVRNNKCWGETAFLTSRMWLLFKQTLLVQKVGSNSLKLQHCISCKCFSFWKDCWREKNKLPCSDFLSL